MLSFSKAFLKHVWPLLIIALGAGVAWYVVNGYKPKDSTMQPPLTPQTAAQSKIKASDKAYDSAKKSWTDKHVSFEPGTSVFADEKIAKDTIKNAAEFGIKYIKTQIQVTGYTDGTEATKLLVEKRVAKISDALTEAGAPHVVILEAKNYQDALKAAKTAKEKTEAGKKADSTDITLGEYKPTVSN